MSEDDSFPTAHTWHAATSFIDEHKNESCILINAGIEFDQEKNTWRGFPHLEMYIFSLSGENLKLKCLKKNLNFGTDIFISDNSIMVSMDQKILIYGGMISRTAEAKP